MQSGSHSDKWAVGQLQGISAIYSVRIFASAFLSLATHNQSINHCSIAIPGPPSNIVIAAVTSQGPVTQASVSWNAPSSNGGSSIVRYFIRCGSGDDKTNFNYVQECNAPVCTSMALFMTGRSYTCQTAAVNEAGAGPYSAMYVIFCCFIVHQSSVQYNHAFLFAHAIQGESTTSVSFSYS